MGVSLLLAQFDSMATQECPCGYYTHARQECHCTPRQIHNYMRRISGPLWDRIDLHIEVPALDYQELAEAKQGESSQIIRQRVNRARNIQQERFQQKKFHCNAHMPTKLLKKYCQVTQESHQLFQAAMNKLNLSARAYNRILKVARTIADLEGAESINSTHLAEAIQYRSLDRYNL